MSKTDGQSLALRKHVHAIYRDFFKLLKLKIFSTFFAQNIHCRYTSEPPRHAEAVLTTTHNLCFGANNKSNRYTPACLILLYESGAKGGKHSTDMFS